MLCKSKFTIKGNTSFQLYLLRSVAIKALLRNYSFYNVKIYREMKTSTMETTIEYPKDNMYWFISFRQDISNNIIARDRTYERDLNWLLDNIKKDIKSTYLDLEKRISSEINAKTVLNTASLYNLRLDQANDLLTLNVKLDYNGGSGLILSEQRVGKSRVAIALASMRLEAGNLAIIISPKSAQIGWLDEIIKMNNYRIPADTYISGGCISKIKDIKDIKIREKSINIFCITYDIFKKLTTSQMKQLACLDRVKKLMLIVDEAHRLRNFTTLQSSAIFTFKNIVRKSKIDLYTIGMSGTPAVKSSEDIFGMLSLINESNVRLNPYINDFNEFKEYFYICEDTSFGKKCKALKRESELNYIIKLCSVQTKQRDLDFFKNYKKEYKKIELDMDEEQKIIYDSVKEDMEFEDDIDCQNKLVQLVRLQQICTDPSGLVASYELVAPKFKWILEFLNKQKDIKILVMSKRTKTLETLYKLLISNGITTGLLKGSENLSNRKSIISEFKSYDINRVLLIQQDVGKEALTLPEARVTVFLDRDFAQGNNEQAEARMTPIDGKPHKKYVVDLVMKNTIEEEIYDKLVIRKESINSINSVYRKES